MMKYMPLVRIETAPMASATSAEALTATSRWTQPLAMP